MHCGDRPTSRKRTRTCVPARCSKACMAGEGRVGRVVVVVVVVKVVVVTVRRGRRTQRPRGYRVWDNRYRSCVILGVECHVCAVVLQKVRAVFVVPLVAAWGLHTLSRVRSCVDLSVSPPRARGRVERSFPPCPDQPPTCPRIPYSGFFSCDHLIPAHLHAVVLSSAKADSLRSQHKRRPGFHAMWSMCGLGSDQLGTLLRP